MSEFETIYFDHNATTPVDPEVLGAMLPLLREEWGNPSSLHRMGQKAHRALDLAREQVAALIGAEPEEILFTSGGTEADAQAVFGVASGPGSFVVTSAVEHTAVLGPCRELEGRGTKVTYAGVDRGGCVDREAVALALEGGAALLSIMAANNDVGTLQPIAQLSKLARAKGAAFHCDAIQAAGRIPFHVEQLGVDLLSLSSHKLYGPKGAGALYVRRGTRLAPLFPGGYQESRRRAGTENVAAIAGFGKACELARALLESDALRIAALRDALQREILARIADCAIYAASSPRLPNTLNVSFAGVAAETLAMALDLEGIAVSTGAACAAQSGAPSHVLEAMGVPKEESRGAIRFSLGRGNTAAEVERTVFILQQLVPRLRGTPRHRHEVN